MAVDIGESKYLYRADTKIEAEAWEANFNRQNPKIQTEIIKNRGKFIVRKT